MRRRANPIRVVALPASGAEGGAAFIAIPAKELDRVAHDFDRLVNFERFWADFVGAHRTRGPAVSVGLGAGAIGITRSGGAKFWRALGDGIAVGVKKLNRDWNSRGLMDRTIRSRNGGSLGGRLAGDDTEKIAAYGNP